MTETEQAERWEGFRPSLKRCGATDAEIDIFMERVKRLSARHRHADAIRALGRFIRQRLDRMPTTPPEPTTPEPPTPEPDLFT